jgi:ATP-dependent exoDNAse (exonuclease V) alpha subunit
LSQATKALRQREKNKNNKMAIYHHTTRMIGRSDGGSPVKALAYISGIQLSDQRTGEIWDFKDKSVQDVQILLPENAPVWARELQKLVSEDRELGLQVLSDLANAAEKRGDAQVYREIEFSLPRELNYEQNKKLAAEYVQDQFCGLGMLAIQSFHVEKCEETGELNPHCHVFFLTRELTEEGLSEKKNRDWNQKEVHEVWREQWAQYASFHLKMHGHDITLDHRSYKDQGIDIEPQLKLGKGVKEQERRAKAKEDRSKGKETFEKDRDSGGDKIQEIDSPFLSLQGQGFVDVKASTERVQKFRDVQLRNLYRILRRPETVFDIVTRHHATFMWGDVQKVLNRYVDDGELFQRLDARLRNSKELLLLKMEGVRDHEGRIEERAIYTTHSMLKAEKELVGTAEGLAACQTHAVSSDSLEKGLSHIQGKLKEKDTRLSEGQEQAIRHLVEPGQLKCIVGYAGAGKTTALEACREIWEAEGYRVYGLAPTGRAAQNLEGSGISSQTLHKFLKAFGEGRSQYSDKSILVLDEAGMVDVGRFEAFLGAVKDLGVKAVVVGDAAQLQPVEAGPAFRLVTQRVGVSRLEEVLRQKEEWQREATVLFGKQESAKAIETYQTRGHVHLVDEKLPESDRVEDVVKRYEISARTSGLIYREIIKDVQSEYSDGENLYERAKGHEDYKEFLRWKHIQKEAGKEILSKPDAYRSVLEERRLDPLEMARLFVNKEQDKEFQYKEAHDLLKDRKLDHLIGVERGQTVEVRSEAKATLIEDWQKAYKENPLEGATQKTLSRKSLLMMAYSNRDVRDLNTQARHHLKASGHIAKEDFTYTITREVEDDFGRKKKFKEEREFSKGDRLVFTRNNYGLGVKNGSIGTIIDLNSQKVHVKLDEGKEISFSPNLNPYFDQGWAVTIHKSQGTTVGKSFLLASHEMNQNLTYVAMTRHQEDVQVYGSACDFWRIGKVANILSKSGEKLSAADYLDSHSLAKLMREEDHFLTKLFTRLSDELHAMGAVSKQAFKSVADHFLGRTSERDNERDIIIKPEVIREENRAQEILKKTSPPMLDRRPEHDESQIDVFSSLQKSLEQKQETVTPSLQHVYEDMKHPAFNEAGFIKRVFEKGLKLHGEEASLSYWQEKREPYMKLYEQKLETVKKELASPLLSYLSEKSQELARKAALEDPDRALTFLKNLQASKQAELDAKEREMQRSQKLSQKSEGFSSSKERVKIEEDLSQKELRETYSSYFRFKDLKHELDRSPYDPDLQKELRDLGKSIYKNKETFEVIKNLDPDISKSIQKEALQKKIDHDINRGRGGLSL